MAKHIYDNSNLAESYAGVTTPLTASFLSAAYAGVYRSFCRLMGVPRSVQQAHETMFPSMVVMIAGRMYYGLHHWYRMVSWLPGWKYNQGFFEQMLGVPSAGVLSSLHRPAYRAERIRTWWQALKIMWVLIWLGPAVKKFNQTFDRDYQQIKHDMAGWKTVPEYEVGYNHLLAVFTTRWRTPIANDFAVMIANGLATRLWRRWIGGQGTEWLEDYAHQPLLAVDPQLAFEAIVVAIKDQPDLQTLFTSPISDQDLYRQLHSSFPDQPVVELIDTYVDQHGDRSPGELKLESATLREQPWQLVRIVRQQMQAPQLHRRVKQTMQNIPLRGIRGWLLGAVISWAYRSLERREQTRYRRTLAFGVIRRLFLQLGALYVGQGKLQQPQDVFSLTVEEAFHWVPATGTQDIERRLNERRQAEASWQLIDAPRRIESDDAIPAIESAIRLVPTHGPETDLIIGTVASRPGGLVEVSGQALVLPMFDPEADFVDKIVVTKHTDPGWTVIFPVIRGLIVEQGGLLSHAAIVAREYGIPCIIGVQGATTQLSSQGQITMDMQKGTVYAS